MSWFRRSKTSKKTPKRSSNRKYPQRKLADVEDIIEQGMLVADVAVRMTVKNEIIMNALAKRVDYDEDTIVKMVRDAITEVADERANDARHIRKIRNEVRERGYSSWMDADYSNGDGRTLKHREAVYDGVAARLYERANNEEYLQRTVERTREAAWLEIGDSLKARASEPYYGGGNTKEYANERESRIQDLISGELNDLMKLRAQVSASEEPDASPANQSAQ